MCSYMYTYLYFILCSEFKIYQMQTEFARVVCTS